MNVPERLRGVAGPILLAVLAYLGLAVLAVRPQNVAQFMLLLSSLVSPLLVSVGVGWVVGAHLWPRQGRRLTGRVLRRMLRAKNRPFIVVTDRPDRSPTRWRRVLEVVGFSAGVAIIVTTILSTLGVDPVLLGFIGYPIAILAMWAAFLLVPYWTSIRMGLRVVDPVRWTVDPVSRRYGDRLRLSNGAFLLIALGLFVNLAVRGGESQENALMDGITIAVRIIFAVLVAAATAVAYYSAREHALVRGMEAEAIAMGVRDGRGMTDGEFLPRVPAPPLKGD